MPTVPNLRWNAPKGTYVRSLARDMGRDLGCYGHISDLRRVWKLRPSPMKIW